MSLSTVRLLSYPLALALGAGTLLAGSLPAANAAITPDVPQAVFGMNTDATTSVALTSAAGDASSTTITGGTFTGTVTAGTAPNTLNLTATAEDGLLTATDAAGDISWITQITGSGNETINAIATDAAGNITVTGTATSDTSLCTTALAAGATPDTCAGASTSTDIPAGIGDTAFIARYGADGTLAWASTIDSDNSGGTAIAIDPTNGDIVVAATVEGNTTIGGTLSVPLTGLGSVVARYGADGTAIAGNLISGANTPTDVSVDTSGNAAVAINLAAAQTILFCATPVTASVPADTCAGGTTSFQADTTNITGAAAVYSQAQAFTYAVLTDSTANTTFDTIAHDTSGNFAVGGTSDGTISLCTTVYTVGSGFAGCPATDSLPISDSADAYLARYGADGTLSWVNRANGTNAAYADLTIDTYGRTYTIGYADSTATFCDTALPAGGTPDTCAGGATSTSTASISVREMIYATYDTDGALLSANTATQTSPGGSTGTAVALTGSIDPGLILAGLYSTDLTVDGRGNPISFTGTASGTTSFAVYNLIAATVTGVTPSSGGVSGGTTVAITGTNFVDGATSVTIGGVACGSVTVTSRTDLTCVTGSSTLGAATVMVTSLGIDSMSGPTYTYIADPPTVTAVTPDRGVAAGGTTVTITGTNFVDGTTSATIGGVACGSITVTSATSLTCTTGAHAAGTVDVVVTVGSAPGTLTGGYTYDAPPTVTAISPARGAAAGGTTVTLTGTNFVAGATSVTVGGVACTDDSVTSATSLTCTTGAHAAGAVDVAVSVHGVAASPLTSGYTYEAPPTITAITPAKGSILGGTRVTITGTNFIDGATSVTIGGVACTDDSVTSATSLTCTTGAHAAGAVDVVVTVDRVPVTSTGAFTYGTAPTVTAISPAFGSPDGGTKVTLTGTNYALGTTVSIGGTACTEVDVVTPTSLTCTTGAHAAGTVDVEVDLNGFTGKLANGYTYGVGPTLTDITPAVGGTAGGTNVTVTGTNFTAGSTISIGGVACTSTTILTATKATCTTGARGAGVVDVTITSGGIPATLEKAYTYVAPAAPETPTDGSITAGNEQLTVTWAASEGPVSSAYGVSGYTVTATPGNHTCSTTSPDTTCTLTGLANGETYDVIVTATNTYGTSLGLEVGQGTPTDVQITVTAKRKGRAITVTGTSSNIAAGGEVTPMVAYGDKAAKAGKPIAVKADGTFAWINKNVAPATTVTIYFTYGPIESNTETLTGAKPSVKISAKRGKKKGKRYVITVRGTTNLEKGTRVLTRVRYSGQKNYKAGDTVTVNAKGKFVYTLKTIRGAYTFVLVDGTQSNRVIIKPV